MSQKLQFTTNIPVRLRLTSIDGKAVPSQFGGDQYMFATADSRFFYVSETVGKILHEQFRKLNVQSGDEIEICKCETELGRGRKGIAWQVIVPGAGAAEPVVPVSAPRPVAVPVKAPVAVAAPAAAPDAPVRPRWADVLVTQTNVLVDAYAAILKHASDEHGNMIRPDDCRALLTTMFIQYAQKGGLSNAA